MATIRLVEKWERSKYQFRFHREEHWDLARVRWAVYTGIWRASQWTEMCSWEDANS